MMPPDPEAQQPAFEYRHVVGFEETSLAGNVYYSNFVRWQGRCREMFLREYAPELVVGLRDGFALITTAVSCEYLAEVLAFDEILICMRLGGTKQNRISMVFDYYRISDTGEELVAKGQQEVACMQRVGEQLIATPIPAVLRDALAPYQSASWPLGHVGLIATATPGD
jgi:enediyne biosynthesis thioesterase